MSGKATLTPCKLWSREQCLSDVCGVGVARKWSGCCCCVVVVLVPTETADTGIIKQKSS